MSTHPATTAPISADTRRPTARYDSPLGPLTLTATDVGLAGCVFATPPPTGEAIDPGRPAAHWLDRARRELDAYFAGTARSFTIPIDQRGLGPFDRSVLGGLRSVGYGATTTYGALGTALGLPVAAVRTVGQALAHNPVLIVVPCHRVVGADGALVGYAGGLPAKRWLLDHESDVPRLDLDLGAG